MTLTFIFSSVSHYNEGKFPDGVGERGNIVATPVTGKDKPSSVSHAIKSLI